MLTIRTVHVRKTRKNTVCATQTVHARRAHESLDASNIAPWPTCPRTREVVVDDFAHIAHDVHADEFAHVINSTSAVKKWWWWASPPHKHEALAAYCVRAISHCICTTKLIHQGGVPTCDLDTHLAYNVGTRVYT